MAVTEASRHALYQRLDVVLGPDETATLMEHLPPVGWADVATKRDLQATKHELQHGAELIRRDLAELDQKLTGRINAQGQRLDGKIDAQGQDLVNKIDAVEQRLCGKIDSLRAEFPKDLRNFLIALTTMMSALAGAVIAVVSHVS
jgi:hypothetical protein